MMKLSRSLWLFLGLAVVLGGCAAPVKPRVLWPAPPDKPRMEFVGNYRSGNDFPKTGSEIFMENIVGTPPSPRFRSPVGIAADGQGKVFISDMHDKNVRVFDFNRRTSGYLTEKPVFSKPIGLEIDSQGRIYVADRDLARIFVFSPGGELLFSFGSSEQFDAPSYLALNESLGRLYVSDGLGHRVVVFDLEGERLFEFGGKGQGDGKLFGPQGLAIDLEGQVFVADMLNARIQVFDSEGTFVRKFGERGDQDWQFENPKDLTFDGEGNLHVLDSRKASLLTYTPEGDLLLVTGAGKPSSHALGFSHPTAIFSDENSRLYVSEMLNRRFSVWQFLTPAYLESHPITDEDLQRLKEIVR